MSYTLTESKQILSSTRNYYVYRIVDRGQKKYRIRSTSVYSAIRSIAFYERCKAEDVELVAIPSTSVHLDKQTLFDRYMDNKKDKIYMVNRKRVSVLKYYQDTVKVKFHCDGAEMNVSRKLLISFKPKQNANSNTTKSKKKNS